MGKRPGPEECPALPHQLQRNQTSLSIVLACTNTTSVVCPQLGFPEHPPCVAQAFLPPYHSLHRREQPGRTWQKQLLLRWGPSTRRRSATVQRHRGKQQPDAHLKLYTNH